jgi:hypothetical protein
MVAGESTFTLHLDCQLGQAVRSGVRHNMSAQQQEENAEQVELMLQLKAALKQEVRKPFKLARSMGVRECFSRLKNLLATVRLGDKFLMG